MPRVGPRSMVTSHDQVWWTGDAFPVVTPRSGAKEDYRTTAEQVLSLQPWNHQTVMLAPCDAARIGKYVHEPWGLPLESYEQAVAR